MNDVLNNIASQNAYVAATTLYAPRSRRFELQVSTAAIFFQLGTILGMPCGVDSITWEAFETFQKPGNVTIPKHADGIRIRSALAGTPAQVTIEGVK